MKIGKTPDHFFDNLPDYGLAPNFVTLDDHEGSTLDMLYIEAGLADGQPAGMVHGNPKWSFMWRKIVKQLSAAVYRAIAIYMIGMGRFDKPTQMKDYTIARHQ